MRIRVALVSLAALLCVLVPAAHAAGPVVGYTVTAGSGGDNGWYLTNVTAQISVSGATDTSCPAVKTFTQNSDALDCTATDGTSTVTFHLQFKIDKDAPSVTGAAAARGPDANGWYRAPVGVSFSGSDGTSGIASCTQPTFSGPDSATATVSGTCRDKAGNTSASSSFGLKYDATAPSVTAKLARAADANGWYNHAVRLELKGDDGLSGIASCDSPTYSGPDTTAGSLSGSCRDGAGNAASQTVPLKYDATPPKLTKLAASPSNRAVQLTWTASTDAVSTTVQRTPLTKTGKARAVYRGKGRTFTDRGLRNGLRYRYLVSATDAAGNVASARTVATPRALIAPAEGARLRSGRPPTLSWFAAPKASYYNVQLYRGRTKVLSAWPHTTKLKLARSWTYGGQTFSFGPGHYRWYVFPGFGERKANRYGALHGAGVFVVR
jgi:hypothetical protein